MNKSQLFQAIQKKQSYLCVGLDADINKIPKHLLKTDDPIFEFNKQIIDATHQYCVAYKPNIAFYEALGSKGWESLQKTVDYIPEDIFTIADAKRGDIGNTSELYARAFFDTLNFDSITVAPYMGEDSITPFLSFENKWTIVLGHTSNIGSDDFQLMTERGTGFTLYEKVIKRCQDWGTSDQLMFVIGATQAEKMERIRQMAPDYFFLVPGVGAQGGSLEDVSRYGLTNFGGLLVNSSRGIIYASDKEDFSNVAGKEAHKLQQNMKSLLNQYL